MSTFNVYGKNVLILVIPPERTYSKFLVIPESYIKESNQGLVKQVGKSVRDVMPGDYVVFDSNFGGSLSDKNGTLYYMLPEHAIKAKIVTEPFLVDGLWHKEVDYLSDGVDRPDKYFLASSESVFECLQEAYSEQKKIATHIETKESDPEPEEE